MVDGADSAARRREEWRASRDHAVSDAGERVRFQASLAEKMLHALLITHGGATIGLFTFIGNLVGKNAGPIGVTMPLIWAAFGCFAFGLGVALAAYVFAFLSQQDFYFQAMEELARMERALLMDEGQTDKTAERRFNQAGNRNYGFGLISACVSIVLFVAGAGFALGGLLPH